jgi:glycosyltransferase involved in cell wall biosynthesis
MTKSNPKPSLSVVIPSIGEPELINTVKSLQLSTFKPTEIIIVIPKIFLPRFSQLKIKNVKVLETKFAGQVQQRIAGFKMSSAELVLQLDSDVTLSRECLRKLVEVIKIEGFDAAVGPGYLIADHRKSQHTSILKKLLGLIINFGEGSIKTSINSFTWDSWYNNYEWPRKTSEMNYLNGGCLLHWKKNLILDNYYPYKDKAYGEDLLHSFFLRKRGIRLLCVPFAKASALVNSYEFNSPKLFFDFIKRTFIYKYKLTKISNGKVFRFYLWFFIFLINQLIVFLRNVSRKLIHSC